MIWCIRAVYPNRTLHLGFCTLKKRSGCFGNKGLIAKIGELHVYFLVGQFQVLEFVGTETCHIAYVAEELRQQRVFWRGGRAGVGSGEKASREYEKTTSEKHLVRITLGL